MGYHRADKLADSAKGGAYEATAMKVAQSMKKQYHSNLLSNPMVVTKAISKAIDSNKPKPRYLIGFALNLLCFTCYIANQSIR